MKNNFTLRDGTVLESKTFFPSSFHPSRSIFKRSAGWASWSLRFTKGAPGGNEIKCHKHSSVRLSTPGSALKTRSPYFLSPGSDRRGGRGVGIRRPGFGGWELTSQEVTATCGGCLGVRTQAPQAAGRREEPSTAAAAPAGSNSPGTFRRRCSGAGCPTTTQTQTRRASPGGRTHAASPIPRPAPEAALGPQAAAPGVAGGRASGDGRRPQRPRSRSSPPGSAAPPRRPAGPREGSRGAPRSSPVGRRAGGTPVHSASNRSLPPAAA